MSFLQSWQWRSPIDGTCGVVPGSFSTRGPNEGKLAATSWQMVMQRVRILSIMQLYPGVHLESPQTVEEKELSCCFSRDVVVRLFVGKQSQKQ